MNDYERGLRKAQELYRSIHSGGCRVLSLGDKCNCFLCQCDREIMKNKKEGHVFLNNYIGDDQVVINVQGLRWIKKEDSFPICGDESYRLEWDYKGGHGTHDYKEDRTKRDEMFNKISAVLTEAKKESHVTV